MRGEFPPKRICALASRRLPASAASVLMLRYAADENINWDILNGLRLRNPDIDVATAQERSMRGEKDTDVLEWAAQEGRILLTHDVNTMRGLAYERIRRGQPTPGVFIIPEDYSVGQAIDDLELAALASRDLEWENRVCFFPLL